MIAMPETYDLQSPNIKCFADHESCSVFNVDMGGFYFRVLAFSEREALEICEDYFGKKPLTLASTENQETG